MNSEFLNIIENTYDDQERNLACEYFSKYWLDKAGFDTKWLNVKNSVFRKEAKLLPDLMFNSDFIVIPKVGGDIFTGIRDFNRLSSFMRELGDVEFAIVQNQDSNTENSINFNPVLDEIRRFHYPTTIEWDELMSGGTIGCEHFNNGRKDYFLFGDQGKWGRYVANSWLNPRFPNELTPLILDGVRSEYLFEYKNSFLTLPASELETKDQLFLPLWLPDEYSADLNT